MCQGVWFLVLGWVICRGGGWAVVVGVFGWVLLGRVSVLVVRALPSVQPGLFPTAFMRALVARRAGLLMLNCGVLPRCVELVPAGIGGYAVWVASLWVVRVAPLAMVGSQGVWVVSTVWNWRSRLPATATRAWVSVSLLVDRVVR